MADLERRFQALVSPHFEVLHRAAFRLTRRHHDAEDLVQEVCLRACRELGKLEALESVRGWLLRVQYRIFVDGVRKRVRSAVDPAADGDLTDSLASEEPGPEEQTSAAYTQERVDRAWTELTPEQRALLALHAEGYGLAELEQIFGTNRNSLSARLHRARARLAKLIGDDARACPRSALVENES
ncbi:MAG TPA: RNA polymerase sigma factor [Gammaproteobacteria bacterium]|nr:RNA polymerase sigma factor [Gammaproteobacteria bacterium]